MAGAPSFAHLLSARPGRAAAKKAEDDQDREEMETSEKEVEDSEDDEPEAKTKSKKAKSKKAKKKASEYDSDNEDDGRETDDDGDGDEEPTDDTDEDAKASANPLRAAQLRERARCARIFADPAAGLNPALAAQLAFNSDMTSAQAIAALKVGAAAPRRPLAERMASVHTPAIAPESQAQRASDDPAALAAGVMAAWRTARGEKS